MTLLLGDCLDVMSGMDANTVHAVVTDPPYDLVSISKRFGKEGSAPAQYGTDGVYQRASRGFMGQSWDGQGIAFKPETWASVLRVMRPGAYLLAFGSPRTYHRMTCAIEDAGFIVRDCLMFLHGQGFPKSHNFGEGLGTALKPAYEPIVLAQKPLDGTYRENYTKWGCGALNIESSRVGVHQQRNNPAPSVRGIAFCGTPGFDRETVDGASSNDPSLLRDALLRIASALRSGNTVCTDLLHDAASQDDKQPSRVGYEQMRDRLHSSESEYASLLYGVLDSLADCPACHGLCDGLLRDVREAALASAPSLADALERICKALLEPVHSPSRCTCRPSSAGVVRLTSAFVSLLVDNTIPYSAHHNNRRKGEASAERRYTDKGSTNFAATPGPRGGDAAGRWPANVVLDEEAAVLLDEMSGISTSLGGTGEASKRRGGTLSWTPSNTGGFGDTGGASRFFYVGKPSRAERERGLSARTSQRVNDGCDTPIDNPYQRGETERLNTHPTVKATALMRHLLTLVVPPDGVVLDPFCGSGSTGVAAAELGLTFIGIEREPSYYEIARSRILDAELRAEAERVLPLFAQAGVEL